MTTNIFMTFILIIIFVALIREDINVCQAELKLHKCQEFVLYANEWLFIVFS